MNFTLYECLKCHWGGNFTGEQIEELKRTGKFTCSHGGKELTQKEAIRGLLQSENPFVKFELISDTALRDIEEDIITGETYLVKFSKPFKKIHKVFLTQIGEGHQDFVNLCVEPKFGWCPT
jgi:Mg2+ and Co2+ transporter CorA